MNTTQAQSRFPLGGSETSSIGTIQPSETQERIPLGGDEVPTPSPTEEKADVETPVSTDDPHQRDLF